MDRITAIAKQTFNWNQQLKKKAEIGAVRAASAWLNRQILQQEGQLPIRLLESPFTEDRAECRRTFANMSQFSTQRAAHCLNSAHGGIEMS